MTTQSNHPKSTRFSKALVAALLTTTMLSAPFALRIPAYADSGTAVTVPGGASSFANLVERVKPAVVSVIVEKDATIASDNTQKLPEGLDKFFKQFGMPEGLGKQFTLPQGSQPMMGQGSGFFISSDGYIVTNNHVVEGTDSIKVQMADGKILKAKLIGTDPKTDLAVIKVDGTGFTHVSFGDSDKARVGDWVIAMGNPFGLGGSTTAGIISARGRDIGSGPYDDFIQLDAPINRGNSGGPTFNASGQVIGINTAIISPSGGSVGIGFAIPSNEAKKVVATLIKDGVIHRGWLGVAIQPVTDDIAASLGLSASDGALVASVNDGSPASKAGLKPGDVITAVDGELIKTPRTLSLTIAGKGPKAKVDLSLWRNGEGLSVPVKLAEMPGDKPVVAEVKSENSKAKLGLMLQDTDQGVVVAQVVPDSPAAETDLHPGDVIKQVAGTEVKTARDVINKVAELTSKGKHRVLMLLQGDNGSRFVVVKLDKSVG